MNQNLLMLLIPKLVLLILKLVLLKFSFVAEVLVILAYNNTLLF